MHKHATVQGQALRKPGVERTLEMVFRSTLVLGPRPRLRASPCGFRSLLWPFRAVNTGNDQFLLSAPPPGGSGSTKQTVVLLGKITKL